MHLGDADPPRLFETGAAFPGNQSFFDALCRLAGTPESAPLTDRQLLTTRCSFESGRPFTCETRALLRSFVLGPTAAVPRAPSIVLRRHHMSGG